MSTAQNIQLYLPGGDEAGVRRAHFTRNSKVVPQEAEPSNREFA